MSIDLPGIMSKKRIETLTDGLFAIVMTILVLQLAVPIISVGNIEHQLLKELYDLRHVFICYITSFILLGFIWMNHDTQFHYIKRVDTGLIWIAVLYLMVIALIPFTTSLRGEYIDQRIPVLLYGINLTVTTALNFTHWSYATKNSRLVDPNLDPKIVKSISRHIYLTLILYVIITIVSLALPILSNAVYIIIPILFVIPVKRLADKLS